MIILRAVKEYYMVDEIEDAIRLQNIKNVLNESTIKKLC